jgi:mannose-1-phosphate guanylyltransferase
MNADIRNDAVWSIVLAGGNGQRLRPWIESRLGVARPKQYCAFTGTRSLVRHTHDRASRLVPPERTVTVIAREHSLYAEQELGPGFRGVVARQPVNRDTAPGVFLPLAHVRAREPDATVVIYPSDHFIAPEERFIDLVTAAVLSREVLDHRLVLLGAIPDRPEPDYGWIHPGRALGRIQGTRISEVRAFREKPPPEEAAASMRSGALWNTFVMVARVETLWRMGLECFPSMMARFERFARTIGSPAESAALDAVYRRLPSVNFSSELLARQVQRIAVLPLEDVSWCDWGKRERILETLRRIGKAPAPKFREPAARAWTPSAPPALVT